MGWGRDGHARKQMLSPTGLIHSSLSHDCSRHSVGGGAGEDVSIEQQVLQSNPILESFNLLLVLRVRCSIPQFFWTALLE